MFDLNFVISISASPYKQEPVDVILLTKVETFLGDKHRIPDFKLSHLQYRELKKQGNKRRFQIEKAFKMGEK